MKSALLILVLSIHAGIQAQITLVLGDDSTEVETVGLYSCIPCGYASTNFKMHPDFLASAWTKNGAESLVKSLIRFNLDAIPQHATIISARLDLYHYNSSMNSGHSQLSGPNPAKLLRVTSAWDADLVTWNTRPLTQAQGAIAFPATTNDSVDALNINLTAFVKSWHANPGSNHGLLFQLDDETPYRAMLFGSAENPDSIKRPILTIVYSVDDHPEPKDSLQIVIPNVFTPNNDQNSDTYRVEVTNYISFRIEIFNRWGGLVFKTDNPEESWDGTFNDQPAAEGVYFGVITTTDLFGETKTFETTVHLLR